MTGADRHPELCKLLELYCEDQLSQQDIVRLEELAAASDESLQFYLDYIELHGSLIWDAAASSTTAVRPLAETGRSSAGRAASGQRRGRRLRFASAAVAMCAVAVVAAFWALQQANDVVPEVGRTTPETAPQQNVPQRSVPQPLELEPGATKSPDAVDPGSVVQLEPENRETEVLNDTQIVARINEEIRKGWQYSGIAPSKNAAPDQWTRRVYLDVAGRIPTAAELAEARDSRAKSSLVAKLVRDSAFPRYWAATWTNLLIGRSSQRGVNRPVFEKFLRDSFAHNVPWNETVAELIAAEGTTQDNGATNFLVAHLNNQAVPATAVTARLFLGIQVQCAQCHDHKSNVAMEQHEFWELNSFFKQTESRRIPGRNGAPPQYVLTSARRGGPTHYETLTGVMKTAYPKFGEREVSSGDEVNRRRELARLMTEEDNLQLARSMVNRVWAHFFGHGFTTPVDDMGPHNPASHPDLLELLAQQFRQADFDLQRLIGWICLSDAYALDSQFAGNTIDKPADGEMPLFSRAYVRSMTPEQVYDSLLVATQSDKRPGFDWNTALKRRHDWIQQFTFAHANEENTESTSFDGSVTQALCMMNSGLVDEALSTARGGLIADVMNAHKTPTEQIRAICRTVLSREPTERELTTFRALIRRNRSGQSRSQLLQDVLWAYLNSNEFILVH